MFVKIPVYIEIVGSLTPQEIVEYQVTLQKHLTKTILESSDFRDWRRFKGNISGRDFTMSVVTADFARNRIVKVNSSDKGNL
jgi:hypothetical protein